MWPQPTGSAWMCSLMVEITLVAELKRHLTGVSRPAANRHVVQKVHFSIKMLFHIWKHLQVTNSAEIKCHTSNTTFEIAPGKQKQQQMFPCLGLFQQTGEWYILPRLGTPAPGSAPFLPNYPPHTWAGSDQTWQECVQQTSARASEGFQVCSQFPWRIWAPLTAQETLRVLRPGGVGASVSADDRDDEGGISVTDQLAPQKEPRRQSGKMWQLALMALIATKVSRSIFGSYASAKPWNFCLQVEMSKSGSHLNPYDVSAHDERFSVCFEPREESLNENNGSTSPFPMKSPRYHKDVWRKGKKKRAPKPPSGNHFNTKEELEKAVLTMKPKMNLQRESKACPEHYASNYSCSTSQTLCVPFFCVRT